jgi:hypothetical protein
LVRGLTFINLKKEIGLFVYRLPTAHDTGCALLSSNWATLFRTAPLGSTDN